MASFQILNITELNAHLSKLEDDIAVVATQADFTMDTLLAIRRITKTILMMQVTVDSLDKLQKFALDLEATSKNKKPPTVTEID